MSQFELGQVCLKKDEKCSIRRQSTFEHLLRLLFKGLFRFVVGKAVSITVEDRHGGLRGSECQVVDQVVERRSERFDGRGCIDRLLFKRLHN